MPAVELKANAIQPSVTFRKHTALNELKSKNAGRPIYDETVVCDVVFPANKLSAGTFPALDKAGWEVDPQTQMRYEVTYAEKYKTQYDQFLAGVQQTMAGTPIDLLPFLSEAKKLELKHGLRIFTAEQLANLDGHQKRALGMEADELQRQTRAYLEGTSSGAANLAMQETIDRQAKELAELRGLIEGMMKGPGVPVASGSLTAAPTPAVPQNGNIDTAPQSEAEILAASQPQAEEIIPTEGEDPKWSTFSDTDLRNMLTEAKQPVDGRWGRKTLVEKVEAAIAERKPKAA